MELPKVKTDLPMPECKKPKPDLSSLRDYFAAKANIEVYAPVYLLYRMLGRNPTVDEMAAWIAEVRFIEADAMIRRRAIDTREISE